MHLISRRRTTRGMHFNRRRPSSVNGVFYFVALVEPTIRAVVRSPGIWGCLAHYSSMGIMTCEFCYFCA